MKITDPGIYPTLSNEDYHASDAIGNSGLSVISERTPAHFIAARQNPRKETPAMTAGTRLHYAILEPDQFSNRYACIEAHDKRTKEGKTYWQNWQEINAGKLPITPDEQDQTLRIVESLLADPAVRDLLAGGIRERSIFANDPETGVLAKCRPDAEKTSPRILIDLKSTEDASQDAFMWSAYRYGYWRQAAFYLDVCGWAEPDNAPEDFFFIAFEKEAPFGHMIYQASPRFLARGREAYRAALNVYAECVRTGTWPCYEPGVHAIDLPEVIHKRMEAEDNDEIRGIEYVQ